MRRSIVLGAALWPLLVGVAHAQTFSVRLRAELEIRAPEGRPAALPLTSERLRAEIDGQHATTTLRQVFTNQTGAALEGRYVLRPELTARVTGFAYYIGEERIVGEVLERQAANQVYDEVTTVRRDPAILEETAAGEFTFRVFPIQPAEAKPVEVTFAQWLARRGQTVTYRVPIGSPSTDAEIVVRDPRARDVRSPTHRIDVEPLPGGGVRVRTRGATDFQGELVLRYRVEERPWSMSVYVHRDRGHAGYFTLSVAAPQGSEDAVAPKDVTLVLDRSGSMSGDAIANARRAAIGVISRLGPEDRVNVIAFDDDVDPLFSRPRPADPATRAEATAFVSRLTDGGGTDLAFALRRALEAQHAEEPSRPRVVIFLTDGQSAPEPVLELATSDQRDVRVFTVGLGSGVNRALLSRLAADKRGRFTYIADASRLEAEVGHLYAQIARPLLVGVSLDVEGAVASRIYPRTLPDVFVDDELTVHGRLRGEGPVAFVLRGRLGSRMVELRAEAQVPAAVERPWVGRRWAIARVEDLLEEIQLKGEQREMRDEVLSLALAYDFVTPYTAFLAIPERELTAQAAQTLARARAERGAAEERHADAVALASPGTGGGAAPVMTASVDAAGGEAPMAEEQEAMAPPMASDGGGAWRRAGCASCTVASPRGLPLGALAAGLALVGLLARRRRRS